MSKKKVIWPNATLNKAPKPKGTYSSLKEFIQKSNQILEERQQAHEFLVKSKPVMEKLLEIRLKNNTPLKVMRPLTYMTSVLNSEEESDGFYNVRKSENNVKFVDKQEIIYPGTSIILKQIDAGMREFIFEDSMKKSHHISFSDKDKLLTQTDIFETIKNLINTGDIKI